MCCVTTSGHLLRGQGAKSRISPLRAPITITQSSKPRHSILWLAGEVFFPSHPSLSAVSCVVVVLRFRFWVPSPLLGQKIFNFYPFKLFMISKHDLLKRLWAFVHSHLIPILVFSIWPQQTSFRICSTDLFYWEHGRKHKEIFFRLFLSVFPPLNMSHFAMFFFLYY